MSGPSSNFSNDERRQLLGRFRRPGRHAVYEAVKGTTLEIRGMGLFSH
jgi:hypothetical protein